MSKKEEIKGPHQRKRKPDKIVTLVHPDSKQELDVVESAVERYETQGWRRPESGAPKAGGSLKAWQDYATARGFSADDIKDKTKDELRAALG